MVFLLEHTVVLLVITSVKVRSTRTYMCEISSILLKFCARFWQISSKMFVIPPRISSILLNFQCRKRVFIFPSNGFFWRVIWIVSRWKLKEVLLLYPLHNQLFVMFLLLRFLVVDTSCSSSSSNNSSSSCSSNNGSPREIIITLLWNGTWSELVTDKLQHRMLFYKFLHQVFIAI